MPLLALVKRPFPKTSAPVRASSSDASSPLLILYGFLSVHSTSRVGAVLRTYSAIIATHVSNGGVGNSRSIALAGAVHSYDRATMKVHPHTASVVCCEVPSRGFLLSVRASARSPHPSTLPEYSLAGSLQRGRRSLPSSPQGAVTVALVVCPGVLTAPSGLRASRNSMPNCKCGHPGHKHYDRRETWRECGMCRCMRYRPNVC